MKTLKISFELKKPNSLSFNKFEKLITQKLNQHKTIFIEQHLQNKIPCDISNMSIKKSL